MNFDNASAAERTHNVHETALVAAAKCGQRAAFDELWQSHAKAILGTTYRITRNRADAEDALQDSLLNAFAHIRDFDGRSSFSSWLTRIAINSALMILRKRPAVREFSLDDPGVRDGSSAAVVLVDHTPDPEASFAQRERERMLQDAIRALRPANRQAIELQRLREHSVIETAQMLGLSVTATKSRLHHAKTELRKSLNPGKSRPARATDSANFRPAA